MATTPAPGIERVPLYVRDFTTGQWYEVGTPVAHSHTEYVADAGDTMTGLLSTAASATGTAGLRIPHGTAPTTPVNGDIWTTTTGIYSYINGATLGPLGAAGQSFLGHASFMLSSNTTAPPTGSQMRLNNASQPAATLIWVTKISTDGLDVSAGLTKILAGHQIYIQDFDDASKYLLYNVTSSAVDMGSYFEIGVSIHSNSTSSVPYQKIELQRITPGVVGLPPGGSTNDILTKVSSANYDAAWTTKQFDIGADVWTFYTAAAPPITGQVRFNGSNTLYVYNEDANGIYRKDMLSTLVIGDHVYLRGVGGAYFKLLISSITDNTTYYTLVFSIVSSAGSLTDGLRVYLETAKSSKEVVDTKVTKTGDTMTGPLILTASVVGAASTRIPHGTAPTSPVDGDVWTTTSGLYARINGSTVGPLSTGVSDHGALSGLSDDDHTQYVKKAGDTMTAALTITGASITANNLVGGVVTLADGASVPGGTPNGTLIVRYNTA